MKCIDTLRRWFETPSARMTRFLEEHPFPDELTRGEKQTAELTTVDLERAMKLSYEMLINCYDKAGVPLVYHSAAVASLCETTEEKIVAYLHDVLEDGKSEQKKEALKIVCTEFDVKIRNAIYAITRKEGERYKDYLDRVKGNDLACHVKIADLKHNLMQWRLRNDVYQSPLIDRYQMALDFLSRKERVRNGKLG